METNEQRKQKAERIADIRDVLGSLISRAHHMMNRTNERTLVWARILLDATKLELEFADRAKEFETNQPTIQSTVGDD